MAANGRRDAESYPPYIRRNFAIGTFRLAARLSGLAVACLVACLFSLSLSTVGQETGGETGPLSRWEYTGVFITRLLWLKVVGIEPSGRYYLYKANCQSRCLLLFIFTCSMYPVSCSFTLSFFLSFSPFFPPPPPPPPPAPSSFFFLLLSFPPAISSAYLPLFSRLFPPCTLPRRMRLLLPCLFVCLLVCSC